MIFNTILLEKQKPETKSSTAIDKQLLKIKKERKGSVVKVIMIFSNKRIKERERKKEDKDDECLSFSCRNNMFEVNDHDVL